MPTLVLKALGLWAVAVAGAGSAPLVGGGAYVLAHLRFQHFLEHSLDDPVQKARVVEKIPCASSVFTLR
jgi:hypothetical protein